MKKCLKIGVVCYPTYGGSGVVATELGQAMAGLGHQIHFITYKRPARLSTFQANVYYHEVTNFEYPLFDFKPYDTALASKIVDIALHHDLDLLHVHYAIPHAIIAFIAKSILKSKDKNLPVITTLHGTDITLVGLDASFYPVVQFSLNQSDFVTAVSDSLRLDTLNAFKISREVEVIPNFIDSRRFFPSPKPELRKIFAGPGEKILMHISNFRKVKRIQDIIQCYARVNEVIPSRLILIGDGPERVSLEDLCRELKISDKVIFLGKQESIETLLNIADVFFLTSDHESFGLSALEAMSCGVPVVSSNIGGIPEVNLNGFSGFTCDVGNVDELTEKTLKILRDPSQFEDFKKNAIEQASKFELNKILPRYLDLYYRALQ
ncbi:MAG TPA: N-acetyl-alpha-D-glucosaminyl L-malate synthase BshA [Saprospiraceae bacterium]|nr:N-acetyl-alpha-D-glucosaminyl L-malate synthase BshA [Saprospiraceae bacterium]HMZ39490.1 N-acetyl-alpha-D-glucosaminyl L-malate synthase BshA [Saprospiraceae bacterium]HNA63276.1 N-acetyl-alpha-D-glucosaminyl L-malate synthase BshA [Saprospiraceae bacterium]HNB29455.1 N-acetyl-alpha-D-glucosaminyl L-malate synthase BshA [Saprospiraceae bacterium]HNC35139.1 N-acetyl-alpha-D-glucosaminyl L-malate synthase BshA [Saprospiraceae bacterium]